MGGFLSDGLPQGFMSGEDFDESFLSLEEEEEIQTKPKRSRMKIPSVKIKKSSKPEKTESDEVKPVDMVLLEDYGGTHNVCWPIEDMDCPDCASKAMNAIDRLEQVKDSTVSATEGTVNVTVEMEKGTIAEISTILRSLGNSPDLPHLELTGVNAESVAKRHGISTKGLPKLFRRQPGVLDCEVDKDGRILLQIVPNSDLELKNAMTSALEAVIGSTFQLNQSRSKRITASQWRMIGSGISFIMLIFVIITEMITGNPYVIGTIGVIGVLAGGFRMFRQAWASIQNKQLGFQVLTSLAVIGASYLQAWEEALMVIVLVSWTEHMENEALVKAREAMQGGLDRLPRVARKIKSPTIGTLSTGTAISLPMASPVSAPSLSEEVPIELVQCGDLIEIRSGELIPADGIIMSGNGSINRAPLTGESVPVDVAKGDHIQAGLTLARGPVTIKVDAVGEETRLSGLIEAVHSFREKPTRLQGTLQTFTSIWVPVVLVGAILAYFAQGSGDWKIILLLWVVACPCALLLAAPVPHAASLSKAAKSGIIARGGDVLEALAKVNLALLDKTGTLTSGKPKIGKMILAKGRRRDAAIALAAGLELSSNHPYAQAIIAIAEEEDVTPTKVVQLSDGEKGVHGVVSGVKVAMIRAEASLLSGKLLDGLNEALEEGHGVSLLLKDDKPVALFTFVHDDLRFGAPELITSLHQQGINIEMLSGDNQEAVNNLAQDIGIPEKSAHGEMTPESKVNWVTSRSKTHITMMVGDGFNDAAAMAASDVGVAIGAGESVNLEAADVLIPGDDPRLLAEIVTLSKKTRSVLIWNIVYSVFITAILVYTVLTGINDNLAIGVLVHELSVIGVIINGARLSGTGGTLDLLRDVTKSLYVGTVDSFRAVLSKT